MRKSLLATAIITLITLPTYADNTPVTTQAATPNPVEQTPQATTTIATNPNKAIDCNYQISPETTTVDTAIIKKWAANATMQSFDLSAAKFDAQMDALKACFTDEGWKGFYSALKQSGNITAIQSQNLTVSSQINGDIKVTTAADNQWKVNLPLEVVYQNGAQKLTQILSVDLLVGRKMSGALGLMQMIATPRVNDSAPNETTLPANAEPTSNEQKAS